MARVVSQHYMPNDKSEKHLSAVRTPIPARRMEGFCFRLGVVWKYYARENYHRVQDVLPGMIEGSSWSPPFIRNRNPHD